MNFSYDFDGVRVYADKHTRDEDLLYIFDFLEDRSYCWDKQHINTDKHNPEVLLFFPIHAIEVAIDFMNFILKYSQEGESTSELKKFIQYLGEERVAANYPNQ